MPGGHTARVREITFAKQGPNAVFDMGEKKSTSRKQRQHHKTGEPPFSFP